MKKVILVAIFSLSAQLVYGAELYLSPGETHDVIQPTTVTCAKASTAPSTSCEVFIFKNEIVQIRVNGAAVGTYNNLDTKKNFSQGIKFCMDNVGSYKVNRE